MDGARVGCGAAVPDVGLPDRASPLSFPLPLHLQPLQTHCATAPPVATLVCLQVNIFEFIILFIFPVLATGIVLIFYSALALIFFLYKAQHTFSSLIKSKSDASHVKEPLQSRSSARLSGSRPFSSAAPLLLLYRLSALLTPYHVLLQAHLKPVPTSILFTFSLFFSLATSTPFTRSALPSHMCQLCQHPLLLLSAPRPRTPRVRHPPPLLPSRGAGFVG